MKAIVDYNRKIARLLKMGPFERRPEGGWRFGTKVIADHVIERLVETGAAARDGDRVVKGARA